MKQKILESAKLLIVDDEERNVRVLEAILARGGFMNVISTTDSRRTEELRQAFDPDLLLLDLHMPYLDGFDVLQQIQKERENYLPVLVLTADTTPNTRNKALAMGAKDFLTKPIDTTETLLRVHNLLEVRFLNRDLEQRVYQRTQELAEAQSEVLQRLAQAAEFRDDDTGLHTRRVGEMAAQLARALGMDDDYVDTIHHAAPLHDVGKIGIPDHILLKPGALTPEEFERMKTHTSIGSQLLSDGHSELVRMAEVIARTHHEKWDGTGYPFGLKEHDIPLEGRILAVCDVFDALTHERPYKKAWSVEDALREIRVKSGSHFDPEVVDAFYRLSPVSNPVCY